MPKPLTRLNMPRVLTAARLLSRTRGKFFYSGHGTHFCLWRSCSGSTSDLALLTKPYLAWLHDLAVRRARSVVVRLARRAARGVVSGT